MRHLKTALVIFAVFLFVTGLIGMASSLVVAGLEVLAR